MLARGESAGAVRSRPQEGRTRDTLLALGALAPLVALGILFLQARLFHVVRPSIPDWLLPAIEVEARWSWLLLPAGLLLSAAVFGRDALSNRSLTPDGRRVWAVGLVLGWPWLNLIYYLVYVRHSRRA